MDTDGKNSGVTAKASILMSERDLFRTGAEIQLSHEVENHMADGIFVFIGMRPNLDVLPSGLELDEKGYIQVDSLMRTSIADVFAAGDIATKPFRQITVAVAEGTVAALQAAKEIGWDRGV